MFTTFSRLSRNEHMPAGERLRAHTWLPLAALRRPAASSPLAGRPPPATVRGARQAHGVVVLPNRCPDLGGHDCHDGAFRRSRLHWCHPARRRPTPRTDQDLRVGREQRPAPRPLTRPLAARGGQLGIRVSWAQASPDPRASARPIATSADPARRLAEGQRRRRDRDDRYRCADLRSSCSRWRASSCAMYGCMVLSKRAVLIRVELAARGGKAAPRAPAGRHDGAYSSLAGRAWSR
jgi:hypothetical protein